MSEDNSRRMEHLIGPQLGGQTQSQGVLLLLEYQVFVLVRRLQTHKARDDGQEVSRQVFEGESLSGGHHEGGHLVEVRAGEKNEL